MHGDRRQHRLSVMPWQTTSEAAAQFCCEVGCPVGQRAFVERKLGEYMISIMGRGNENTFGNAVVQHIIRTRLVTDRNGTQYPVTRRTGMTMAEGSLLHDLITMNKKLTHVLVIGMGYGLPSLYLLLALAEIGGTLVWWTASS